MCGILMKVFPKISYSILYGIYTGFMPLVMSGLVSFWAFENIESLKSTSLVQVILIWIAFTLAMGLSLIPTTFVALICGYIWGFNAIIPLVVSYSLATFIGANLSKWIDNDQILNQINKNPRAKSILSKLQNETFKIVALARLSPVFPFGISNVIFTYLGVPLSNLLFAGIIGMLPRTLFMVWIASRAESIQKVFSNNWQNYIQSPIFWVGIISFFLLLVTVYQAFKKK
jgi:uncharacterized membrane protein YdjX (TVP38/TMEM64 family)